MRCVDFRRLCCIMEETIEKTGKMTMKRFVALAVTLAIICSLTACSDQSLEGAKALLSDILSYVTGATSPTETAAPTKPSQPASRPTEPPTEATEPPTEATVPPTEETEPPTEATEPPTEATEPTPTQPKPTDPPASEAITIGSYIPGIWAKKAFVYDFESKSYLYMKGEADSKLYPASITKLMNAYTAVQIFDVDDILTMDQGICEITPFDTSLAGIYAGNQMTFLTALQAMLIPSGSDAAHLIAVSGGRILAEDPYLDAQAAEDVFVAEMNRQADLLGLVNTHFVHADGYPDYNHYTCMADLTIIAAACLDTPLIRDTVKMSSMTLHLTSHPDKETRISTNLMLRPTSRYYHPEACGMKTGTTEDAGNCLLGAFRVDGRYVLIGVFNAPSNSARYDNATSLFQVFCGNGEPYIPAPEPGPEAPTEITEPAQPSAPPTQTTEATEITEETTQT